MGSKTFLGFGKKLEELGCFSIRFNTIKDSLGVLSSFSEVGAFNRFVDSLGVSLNSKEVGDFDKFMDNLGVFSSFSEVCGINTFIDSLGILTVDLIEVNIWGFETDTCGVLRVA